MFLEDLMSTLPSSVALGFCQWRIQTGSQGSGTRSKFPKLNENGHKSHFLRDFSDSEPGQHFV